MLNLTNVQTLYTSCGHISFTVWYVKTSQIYYFNRKIIQIFNLFSGFLTAINCYNVKWVTRVQDSFTATKVFALLLIFFASLWYLFSGHTENLESMMQGTNTSPSAIAIAFYTGLFSYSGWNYLNFVTEELKDPYRLV